ncbi:MAG: putative bifunctional diguanylate cyclase/phosphodiesterase [Pseudomonadota bacterium]
MSDGPISILLVDDDPDMRALLARFLGREFSDLHVSSIGHPQELQEAFAAGDFDLVVTDYQVHWTTGLEVLREAKSRWPDCPVIMFTATGSEEIAVEAMKADLDDYILKSHAHLPRLALAVRAALNKSRQRQALADAEFRYRGLFDGVPVGLYQTTSEGRILDANPALLQMLGYPDLSSLKAINVTDLCVHAEGYRRLQELLLRRDGKMRGYIAQLRRYDGSVIWAETCSRVVCDAAGQVLYHEGAIQDITERRSAEARIHYLAHHDDLTGLPNRVMFKQRLEQAIAEARRYGHKVAVLLLDMDRFKTINDTLGHDVGDGLIKAVAMRLNGCVREIDTVSRLAGDEFAFILPGLAVGEDAARVAQKILDEFAQPFWVSGYQLFISASIGIALYPADGQCVDTLLKNVDAAMYHTKEHGRSAYQFYAAEMNARAFERLALEHALRHALERNELVLHYQPQIALDSGKIVAMEALLRWRHPELGLIAPMQFIPIAEETGMIVQIGEWVLHTACAQNKVWQEAGLAPVRMAVNLSVRQLRQPNLGQMIERVLQDSRLEPRYLELELTESMLMQNAEVAIPALKALGAMGIEISIDDFGTGYSSLSYLKRLPIHALKIDRSFVCDIPADHDDAAIAMAIIAMAHNLGIRVIAEGVETAAQQGFLVDHYCDAMQGFHLSTPLPASEAVRLLACA